LAWYY